MRFTPSIFGKLLEPIDRRRFQAIVDRHDGDAYDKSFTSLDHLLALVFAQLSGADGLRALAVTWNAARQHHYHLGAEELARSTVSDAGKRRPVGVFAEAFELVAGLLDRQTRRDENAMLRLVDSTPIPLGELCKWAKLARGHAKRSLVGWPAEGKSNGRIRGMKVHVVYDPATERPRILAITDANVNDAQIGRTLTIEPGATYVFDKGYCHYGWWAAIAAAGSLFVTRPKTNMKLALAATRDVPEATPEQREADGFTVLLDEEVALASKGDSKLPVGLRRLRVRRHADGKTIELLTNDLARSARAIGALYRGRWQIELLFRWLKQHLRIRKFLGNNDNAIRLQIYAAMIAFALLRIAARTHRVTIPILRFIDLVGRYLLERRNIGAIDKPPPINPSVKRDRTSPNQMAFAYA